MLVDARGIYAYPMLSGKGRAHRVDDAGRRGTEVRVGGVRRRSLGSGKLISAITVSLHGRFDREHCLLFLLKQVGIPSKHTT